MFYFFLSSNTKKTLFSKHPIYPCAVVHVLERRNLSPRLNDPFRVQTQEYVEGGREKEGREETEETEGGKRGN